MTRGMTQGMTGMRDHPDAGAPLVRALLADAAAAGCAARIVSAETRDWASATFVGAQHWIVVAVTGEGLGAWLARLPEAELPMPRHIVGDLVVDATAMVGKERYVTIAALTLVNA